ncbi:Hypothetical_protein [Hexamita inflata]|uniref:Hypothetical_protein n=1 Tax=Hexamita inflata TaxID=28002 RepID=A0AA86R906_9EUKA|nr:Hypothetical protein HINF_LOCUS51400 [Hexamita inflata]
MINEFGHFDFIWRFRFQSTFIEAQHQNLYSNDSSLHGHPRLKVDELKTGRQHAKCIIMLCKSTPNKSRAERCSIYLIVDLFKIQILQPNNLEHQIHLYLTLDF